MTPDRIARRVVVSGDVQGVFFRAVNAPRGDRRRRRGLGAQPRRRPRRGLVRRPSDAVARLVRWCADGPRHATVSGVEVSDAEPEGFDRFAIR